MNKKQNKTYRVKVLIVSWGDFFCNDWSLQFDLRSRHSVEIRFMSDTESHVPKKTTE